MALFLFENLAKIEDIESWFSIVSYSPINRTNYGGFIMAEKSITNRFDEMFIGIIGGSFGIIGGILPIVLAVVIGALKTGAGEIIGLGVACIIISASVIIFSCMINKSRVVFGIIILVCGVLNIVLISFYGFLSGLLIIVAGILALIRK